MEPEIPLPADLPPDSDELIVLGQGKVPYPMRRRRAVSLLVTVAWMMVLAALCAYILMKW